MTAQTVVVALATVVLILTLVERVRRVFVGQSSPLDRPVVFFAVVFGLILILRWPVIVFPQGINPDEAQMLAQAARFCVHPVPWRDVDGNTGGPLDSMLLSVPVYLGLPASWVTARIVLWGANCLTIIFLNLALRVYGTSREAQLVLIPTILFYAFALDANFCHYSSETLAVLLLSAGLYLLFLEWNSTRPSGWRLFLLGLISGILPFTKLQATPLGLFLFAMAFARLFAAGRPRWPPIKVSRRHRPDVRICFAGDRPLWPVIKERWREAASLCLGMVTMSVVVLGWIGAKGAISDFWISYVLASGAYAQQLSFEDRFDNICNLFIFGSDFPFFLLSMILAIGVMLRTWYARGTRPDERLYWPMLMVGGGGLLTVLCIFIAGKAFPHYLLLLVPFLATLQGLVGFAYMKFSEANSNARFPRVALVLAALVFLPQVLEPVQYVRGLKAAYPDEPSRKEYAVTKPIRDAARPGDTMSIWGWMPSYYVETGLIPATRDAVTAFAISAGPYQDYFRTRFLADLERSRPVFFIDAVSDGAMGWWDWNDSSTHEGFPELAAYVDENYDLWWTIHLMPQGHPVRIYQLKSRMAELHLAAGNVENAATQ
jgi:hypothetical protein